MCGGTFACACACACVHEHTPTRPRTCTHVCLCPTHRHGRNVRVVCCLPVLPHSLQVVQARKQPVVGDEWSSIFPISTLIDVRLLPTKPLSPSPVTVLPYVRLVSEDTNVLTAADGGGTYRDVTFEVYTEAPCWGLLNITSDSGILSWTLTPEKWPRSTAPRNQIVRWTTQQRNRAWRVTVRVAAGTGDPAASALRVTLHVDYLRDTPQIKALVKKLPAWGTMTYAATSYVSEWVL